MTEQRIMDLSILERRIDYSFKDKNLLARAVTHRSFSATHNERLEFLGDSVLNCVVGHALFLRDKHYTEGVLSRTRANFVCEKTLDEIAAEIKIGEFIRLGEGELKTGGASRPSILADACEAVFGAVFLDAGFEVAQRVILRLYEPILAAGNVRPERFEKDAKTQLQEFLQSLHEKIPVYAIVGTTGAAHEQTFCCECRIDFKDIRETGKGRNRRAAEQEAARKVLERAKAAYAAKAEK